MNTTKRVLNPERLRQVPEHFSWLDHRLVREHTIEQADVAAWALYLFLVTVADGHGLSYYGDATVDLFGRCVVLYLLSGADLDRQ